MMPRRLLFALGALLVGINVLSALWDIRNERALVERNALRDFNNLTALLADQTARSLESAGLLVRAAASDISSNGIGKPAARVLRLKDRISGIPQVRGLLMLDRDGRIVLSTDERSEIAADYSSRSYFTQLRDGKAQGPYVSEPFLGQITHRWSFAVSEPVTDSRGRFEGIVAAIIDMEYFERLYRSLDIGGQGFVALLTRSGTLLTRVPRPHEDLIGKQLPDPSGIRGIIQREGRYSGWATSAVASQPTQVLISLAPVADAPLVVEVGAPERAVLAPWYTESARVIARTLLTSAVMLALVALAARALARRARADAQARESRRLAEAEQQRLQAKLRQAEKMEAVGRLAGGIAHDFNNNLGGIIGYGEMLLESTADGSPEQRYARNLLIAANRARELVDQILTYSRSQNLARGPVELGGIVRETLEVIRGSLPAEIALEPSLPQAPLVVVGDPTQLHQVVMNLCTNAIHAMGGAGTLAVSLEAIDLERELTFAHDTVAPGRYVKFVVSDTGTGMDGATLARIFEPFFTTKDVGRGTGLGLSLVYGIVADSGGATHVTSVLGRGSTFEIYLPRADVAGVAVENSQGPIERGHGERVLLVDDEKPLLIMTAELLTRLGYDPAPFSDPHSALASLEAMPEAYDIVLTDEMMPGLTGTALARAARKARSGLPIILISGYTGPMLTQIALGAGVRDVLRKPVQSRELAAALARALASRSPARRAD
jgi:signal transduction histidine kinase/ActR/RegA family two-component response regulator